MNRLKRFSALVMVGVVWLALAGCAPAVPGAAQAPSASSEAGTDAMGEDKVLTILYWQAASLPGPYLSGGTKDQDAGAITLEPLANYAPDGTLVPKLALEIPTRTNGGVVDNAGEAGDATAITWTLKPGVQWSDGSDLTAADVVFTWEYCIHPDTGCTAVDLFDGVMNVEAVDDQTVQITFANFTPYPYLAFVTGQGPILQKAQFADCVGSAAQECNEQNTMPHGTGPYRLTDFKVNDVAVYERNPYFHGEPAYFDRVVFKGGGDAAAAARAVLETGEADYAWNMQVEPQVLMDMESKGGGEIITAFGGYVERILVNQTNPDPALDDDRSAYMDGNNPHPFLVGTPVAQAMSMAIDRTTIAETLYGFAGQATCNVIAGPSFYASTANDDCLVQDIEGANALLDEAGIVDSDGDGVREYNGMPLSVRYQTSTNTVRQKTQALVKQWWSQIGIETELLNHDASVFFGGDPNSPDTYQKFFTDVQMYTTGPATDPQIHLGQWQCSYIPTPDNAWGGGNIARNCNPAYDALFAELVVTPLGPEREALVKALNDLMVQNGILIPLVHRGVVSAKVHGLENIQINGWDTEMWNIQDWARAE